MQSPACLIQSLDSRSANQSSGLESRMSVRTCTTLPVLAVVLNCSILGIRVHNLLQQSALTTTTGTQGSVVYAVWKVSMVSHYMRD